MALSALLLTSLLSFFPRTTSSFLPARECPILGPAYDRDFDLLPTEAFQAAKSSFSSKIESLFESGELNRTHSVFAIDVYSTYTNESIFNYFYTGSALKEGFPSGTMDDETVWRVGSVSKLFTLYAILAHATRGVFEQPVTVFLPELKRGSSPEDKPLRWIDWDQITIGALAAQQAGAGGMQFLKIMRDSKRPTAPPFSTALYADGGWGALGRVLERMTGLSYNDAIQQVLSKPLGLDHTSSYKPNGTEVNGMIVPDAISWGWDNQVTAPSGGIYSNCRDVRRMGLSILHSTLLDTTTTNWWMKPHSHTASLTFSVGAPWEIYRLTLPVSSNSTRYRISDQYTKGGGNDGYGTIAALSPDHGLGYTVFVGGPGSGSERWSLLEATGGTFVPAAELAGRENARKLFAGTYVDKISKKGTNMTITVDPDHPGLGIESLFLEGVDSLGSLSVGTAALPSENVTVRLYPAGLEEDLGDGKVKKKYRAIPQSLPADSRSKAEGGKKFFDVECQSWFSVGFSGALDEFVFTRVDGKVVEVRSVGAKAGMKRFGE
ncbi:uncharacterized protein LTR77_007879 [Saxophila tyrrhenica]|uniref:Beta-lactamase-related domain-containing protein n=1 Tax=Saxophila tyrrhenica TaxID=1690608 RepID=A0AAV9P3D3_9PEZI|nr:hypothetical protein LTR77_007879 [Saxophila tyrrhenica]